MAMHTLNALPDSDACIASLTALDVLIIMDAAVYLLSEARDWSALPCQVYVLAEDIDAAGLTAPTSIEIIDYAAWVALSTEHQQHVAWY